MIPCNLYRTSDGGVSFAAGVLDQVRVSTCYGRDDLIESPLGPTSRNVSNTG
jgi:hypothetical protein